MSEKLRFGWFQQKGSETVKNNQKSATAGYKFIRLSKKLQPHESPAATIMEFIANHADPYNISVEQAEDEIAAVNMVFGANYAGARAMTATFD